MKQGLQSGYQATACFSPTTGGSGGIVLDLPSLEGSGQSPFEPKATNFSVVLSKLYQCQFVLVCVLLFSVRLSSLQVFSYSKVYSTTLGEHGRKREESSSWRRRVGREE